MNLRQNGTVWAAAPAKWDLSQVQRKGAEGNPVSGPYTVLAHNKRSFTNGFRHDVDHRSPLSAAMERTCHCLLERQAADGHWVGELQGDTILESEYILLLAFLGREGEEKVVKAARYILTQQLPEGGWNNYRGGQVELRVSVKAYFALKLAGQDPNGPAMRRACALIRELGGAAQCNSFTKFYLALLGQFPYANCPAVPPEMMLLPKWAYINIYAMSSWTRTIIVPLSIFYAHKPVRVLPPGLGIRELFLEAPETPLWPHPPTRRRLTATNFFLALDQVIKRLEAWGLGPVRSAALKRAKAWLLEHFPDSDGVGAIFPPMIYTVVSLRCLGYPDDSPEMRWALKQLDDLILEEDQTLRVQPCFSPVWDTALTLIGLADAGLPGTHPAVRRAAHWLIDREVRRPGDWSVMNPSLEPGGWFFEYRNGLYPDTDDTAMVLTALAKSGHAWKRGEDRGWRIEDGENRGWRIEDRESDDLCSSSSSVHPPSSILHPLSSLRPAVVRGLRWLLRMQNRDAGWAAFARRGGRADATKIPFP